MAEKVDIESLLRKVRDEGRVYDRAGDGHDFHSAIDEGEGRFLSGLVERFEIEQSIEVGCAFGVSSLHICNTLSRSSKSPKHTIIDPFQNTQWKGVGLYHLEQCGFDFVNHVEEVSELALPKLLRDGGDGQFDFAFIDGWHTMDHTMLDCFYMNRLLKVGGVLVVDDVNLPPVNRAVRNMLNYPCYEHIGKADFKVTRKAKLWMVAQRLMQVASRIVPRRHLFFNGCVLKPDQQIGVDSSMVAMRKIANDDRPWNWYEPF